MRHAREALPAPLERDQRVLRVGSDPVGGGFSEGSDMGATHGARRQAQGRADPTDQRRAMRE